MRLRAIPALRLYPGGHRSSPRAKRVVSILTRWLFVLVPAVGWLVVPPLHGAVPTSDSRPVALKPGEPLVRQISRGEVQTFSVQAQAGHFLYLLVEQQEVDVAASLSAPDGRKLLEVDNPNGPDGPEVIALAVRDSGDHTLTVTTSGEGRKGQYTILLEAMRPVTRSEEQRLAAETHFAAAEVLRKQDSADALRGAAEKYEAALAVWRESEDRIGHARALIGLGFVLATLDEHDKAIATFQNALETSISANLVRGQASIWTSLGTIRDSIGEKQKALDAYEKAVPLWRSSGYLFGLAETINSIGLVHDLSGDRPRALEHYREALGYFETLGDSRGQAFALSSIARAESELGDTQRSLQTYVRALSLVRRIGERRGEAAILTSIGLIYGALGERQQAIRYFEQAVPLRKEAGDRRGEAATYTGLGKTYLESGDPEKARDYYTRALALSREVKDPRGEGVALTRLGSLHEALGDMERALDHHRQALRLRENLQDRTGAAFVLARIGSIHESRGEVERARESFQRALDLSREVRHDVPAAEALLGLARLARGRSDLEQARSLTEQALERIESLRARVTSPDLRASYLSTVRATFELYTDLLMELHRRDPAGGFDALALVSSERARARSLLELLSESRTEVRLGVDPQLLARERELKQRLSSKADRQVRLLNSKHTAEQAAVASKEIDELASEIDSVQASIRAASPRYAALTQPLARSVEEIQTDLDPETALLEFSLGERRSFLWVVRAHSLESFDLPGRLPVEKLAGRVYRLLTSRNERVAGEGPAQRLARVRRDDEEYLGAAAELSRMLFPEGAELAGLRRLAVVADGALQYLPFSTLPMRGAAGDRMPLLVESHEVISLPSASVLSLLRSDSKSRPAARNVLAVIADPVFDRADERVRSLAGRSSRPGLGEARASVGGEEPDLLRSALDAGMGAGAQLRIPRLPFSRREAERILSLAPLKRRKRALDFDASRSVVVSGELARYRIVHFATHGILNTQRPELSGLVLSLVDRQGRDQPGFLTAAEVFNLELGADLVVLSGCQTALGRELQGEGLIGLTRGFMYAGAPRVVASLWKVEDAATAELMARFYRGMLGPERLRPAAALRAAQGSMRKVPRWSLPYYWAGFVLQGEWQ